MPSMFRVQPSSGEPIYQQLRRQVKNALASGLLTEGARLPTVRDLAEELGVNPNTVARAYRELEAEGVLETTRGRGTFVRARTETLLRKERERRLQPFVEQLLAEGLALGFTAEHILEFVRQAVERRDKKVRSR